MGKLKIDFKTKQAIQAFIIEVAKHYDLAEVILFGSRARSTHREDSDTDLAIILHGTPKKFISIKFSMDDMAYDILLDTGIHIQPIPIWTEEWAHPENYSNPRLLENIHREGIRL